MFECLRALRWHVLRLTLVNTRNAFAREPPLAVFEALGYTAARRAGLNAHEEWFFHPAGQSFGSRVRRGARYAVVFVFPRAEAEAVALFRDALAKHLTDPRNNFALETASNPLPRTLADLEQESADLEALPFDREGHAQVCLEFLAPLAFAARDSARRWLLDAPGLIASLTERVARLGGPRLSVPEEAVAGLTTLPCYWHYEEHRHASKSKGGRYLINGCAGPLYLSGNLQPWLPLLRLGAEWHAGDRLGFAQGAYALRCDRAWFTGPLANPQTWHEAYDEAAAAEPGPDAFLHPVEPPDAVIRRLVDDLRTGDWRPEAARGFKVEKESGGAERRLIVDLGSRDRLVHRVLHQLLQPVWDRLFEASSHGFRPGRSVCDAREAILAAIRSGCRWVVETDVAACFDSLDWARLETAVERALPRADGWMRDLLQRAIRQPLRVDGSLVTRTRGVLQGSPLSPLLANLYLDPFDEACAKAGLRLVRYADDFLVLCRDEVEAVEALANVERLLAELGLTLKREKTAITPIGAGFQFLGQSFEPELDEEFLERTTLRRPAHVAPDYAFVGLDGETLTVRRRDLPAGRIPLRRIGELIVHGPHAVSTPLLMACAGQGIPVALCSSGGWHVATVRAENRRHYALAAGHLLRHRDLSTGALAELAREFVAAKVDNYTAWAREIPEPEPLVESTSDSVATAAQLEPALDEISEPDEDESRPDAGRGTVERLERLLVEIGKAASAESLRGLEGSAARITFRWVNRRVRVPEFTSAGRLPRKKPDRWNALLDFAYSQLFARLNVLVRTRGLNPWLGFLHSAEAPFESLVCDLQEPFRVRCDRWALRLVNKRQVKPEDFERDLARRWRPKREVWPSLVDLWGQELDRCQGSDAGTWEQLLHAQVEAVREWAEGASQLRVYRSTRNRAT